MRKLAAFLTFCFVITNFHLNSAEYSEQYISTHRLMGIAYERSEGDSLTAFISLSTGTTWKLTCDPEDHITLDTWQQGDEIYITTDDHVGIQLENVTQRTIVYASPTKESLDLIPMIDKIEVVDEGWICRNNQYYIHLDDGSVWKVFPARLTYRWSRNQRVILSNTPFSDKPTIANVNLEWDPDNRDDRSVFVTLVESEVES